MGNDHYLQRSSVIFSPNELVKAEELLMKILPLDDDYDDYELPEIGCEFAMVGGRTCSIPYDLFDLPDLKGVLSLEAWNCQLTEDERFSLAVFLPDMDQETFWLTIKELLTGDDMFFGSPLEKFYTELKGGAYSPKVTCLREGLKFLQKNEYYHSLRSYHVNMTQSFAEMKQVWDQYRTNINTVEERVHIWKNRRDHKPKFVVDLNAFPEEDILTKEDGNVETLPLAKKAKYAAKGHDSTILLNGLVSNHTNRKAKGVLKLKPLATNLVQSQVQQAPSRRVPKGVLKIKQNYDPLNQEKSRGKLEQISADVSGICAPFSPSEFAFKNDELNFSEKLPIFCQINRDGSSYRNPEAIKDRQREETVYAGFGSFKHFESCQKKQKLRKDVRQDTAETSTERHPLKSSHNLKNYSQGFRILGEFHSEKKNWSILNAEQNISSIGETSTYAKKECLKLAPANHQELRLNARISEAGSMISNNCGDKYELLTNPSEHLEREIKDDTANVAMSGIEKCLMFPITYKRKKPYRKLNQVDSIKQQPVVVNLESATPSGTDNPKPMAIKIKFRGWNGQYG
ncbi:hypothetical protein Cni_G22719 [Canna indica]|uniref:DEUBAD domain-containing protein n=1 Tax=Canna indica TaxID=4628 RepID=A0AAQ3KSW5_9LILI|nr:hypothetical protein Cni_G22719 [Canna indica]